MQRVNGLAEVCQCACCCLQRSFLPSLRGLEQASSPLVSGAALQPALRCGPVASVCGWVSQSVGAGHRDFGQGLLAQGADGMAGAGCAAVLGAEEAGCRGFELPQRCQRLKQWYSQVGARLQIECGAVLELVCSIQLEDVCRSPSGSRWRRPSRPQGLSSTSRLCWRTTQNTLTGRPTARLPGILATRNEWTCSLMCLSHARLE